MTAPTALGLGGTPSGHDAAATPDGQGTPESGSQPSATADPTAVAGLGSGPSPSATRPKPTTRNPRPVPAGFPNANNTGWQHTGVSLKPYTGASTVRRAGTVIDGKDIGCIWIQAANVTIKRSRVRCNGEFPVRVHGAGTLTIVDTEIDGLGNVGASCVTWEHYVARRINCHGVGDGMWITGASVTIEDSYIHDLVTCGSCHNDTLQATAGSQVVIRHNTMENHLTQTSVIKLGNETGALRDFLLEQNLFNGGGYTVYAGGTGGNISNLKFLDNFFVRAPQGFFPNGGKHGPVAYYDKNMPGNEWSGNRWLDGGQTINAGMG